MAGDIIRVQDSALSATVGVLNELSAPFVGVYSVYSLFKP
jgi:polysaccharide export outer membrane protein